MKLEQLKAIALELGISREEVRKFGDLRRRETWENAIAHRENAIAEQEKKQRRIEEITKTREQLIRQSICKKLPQMNLSQLKAIAEELEITREEVKKVGPAKHIESWLEAVREKLNPQLPNNQVGKTAQQLPNNQVSKTAQQPIHSNPSFCIYLEGKLITCQSESEAKRLANNLKKKHPFNALTKEVERIESKSETSSENSVPF